MKRACLFLTHNGMINSEQQIACAELDSVTPIKNKKFSHMKTKILVLFLLVSFYTQAQNTTYEKDVKHFIEINGTIGQYYEAITQLSDLLKSQYQDANVSESDWIEMDNLAKKSITGLTDDLVVVYKKYFTHEEIIELNKHYENEIMQRFVNNVVNLSDASQDASIVWSRSLYNQLTDYLDQKGYSK